MRRRRRREEWQRLVARWEASGASAKDFARDVGVHAGTLQYWKYALARAARESRAPALAKIVEVRPAPVALTDDRFEVRLGGGRRVGVPASFDGEALRRLLLVLEAAS